nr:MAG TPA: hypothetical protein [Caudoviricetes sp.]
MSGWVETLKFVGIPGALLALYFGYLKFGFKVGAHYSFSFSQFEAQGISQVTLVNLKDRSLPIFALYANQGNVIIELIRFEAPLVLKSFDSLRVDIPRVSQYFVDGKPYEFSARKEGRSNRTKIYYSTVGAIKACKLISPPDMHTLLRRSKRPLELAQVSTIYFNEKAYSPRVIYIVEYKIDDKWDDAFINIGGIISWNFLPNAILQPVLADPQVIANQLLNGLPRIQKIAITKTHGWYQHFKPDAPINGSLEERPFWGERKAEANIAK